MNKDLPLLIKLCHQRHLRPSPTLHLIRAKNKIQIILQSGYLFLREQLLINIKHYFGSTPG